MFSLTNKIENELKRKLGVLLLAFKDTPNLHLPHTGKKYSMAVSQEKKVEERKRKAILWVKADIVISHMMDKQPNGRGGSIKESPKCLGSQA